MVRYIIALTLALAPVAASAQSIYQLPSHGTYQPNYSVPTPTFQPNYMPQQQQAAPQWNNGGWMAYGQMRNSSGTGGQR